MAGSFSPFRLPEYEVPRNSLLDFSPFSEAVKDYQNAKLTREKMGMEQERLGMDRERLGLAKASDQRQQESHADDRRTKLAQSFGGIGQMILDEKDPVRQNEMYQRLVASDPRIKESLGKYLPKELLDDPVVASKYFVAQARGVVNPLDDEAKRAQIALAQANADKARREASGDIQDYGKAGAIMQNPDGTFSAVQFGSRGQLKEHRLGAGVAPAKGVFQAGDEILDKSTGGTVRNIAPQIEGKEAAEERGKATGKAQGDLPRIADNAALAVKTINQIRNHPGKEWGVGAVGVVPGIPGTHQRGFVALVDQAKGKTFLEAFNSLRGGGQITEAEGNKATQALARLDRAQTQADFDAALNDLEEVVNMGLKRAQTAVGGSSWRQPEAPGDGGGWSIKRK